MSQSSLKLDRQICFSLYTAANAVVRSYRPLLDRIDLTYLQYLAMLVLWEKDGISVKALGERLHLDSGTLTPLLKRLAAKNLVERQVDPEDERARKLVLTKEGKALKVQAESVPEHMLCNFSVSPDRLYHLKQECDELIKSLTDD